MDQSAQTVLLGEWRIVLQLVGLVVTLFVAGSGIWKFIDSRNRELKWKRTEFVFSEAGKLDSNEKAARFIRIIDGVDQTKVLEVLDENGKLLTHDECIIDGLHNLLNTLDRLTYAHKKNKVITLQELEPFFWYFTSIYRNNRVANFAVKNGYKSVIDLAEEINSNL